ncbi:hypothetical protein [Methanobrevibacter sp.]|uniref:hypothetical protein n=1 Tax=Methanobrevibacter sp. TaxID=66852 RepID=UPI00263990C2|nr:hypothetical protein [uncultured Methanobrevibacter sp.]
MNVQLLFKDDEMLYYGLKEFYKHLEDEFELNNSTEELRVLFNNTQEFELNHKKVEADIFVFSEDEIYFEKKIDEKHVRTDYCNYNSIDSLQWIVNDEFINLWTE